MRIAIGGIMHESNTFATIRADRLRFEQGSIEFGAEILTVWRDAHHEVGGFIEGVERYGAELLPTAMAWATPSGPVDDRVVDEIVNRIIRDCQSRPIDGLLLALHGAMVTPKHPSADTEVLRQIRVALGAELPIVATLDFHANCSPAMGDYANALIGYQTYPHIDQRQRGLLAADLLVRTIRGDIRPVSYIAKRPMIANILGQCTDREPLSGLMAEARERERSSGLLSISVMGGFYYADVPDMGPSVIAVANGDRSIAKAAAEQLADRMWDVRHELYVECASPKEAVRRALDADRGPVILVDLGDNIGGGSTGDGTVLLAEILKQGARGSIVAFFAPNAVARCREIGVGRVFEGLLGGAVDRLHGEPIQVRGRIASFHDGTWIETEARHGGRRQNDQGSTVVVEMAGDNTLVLNSLQTPPFSLGQLTSLGIDPTQAKMIVVKAAVAYKAAYAPLAASIIEVDTPGVTAVNPGRFTYRTIPRPMFPLDEI